MTVSHAIETVNIAIGMISNSLLIFLSLRFSKKNLGTYKYLLMIFACYDIFLTVIHVVIDPKVHDFGTIFTLYSSRFVDNTWLVPIYVSCFSVPFVLTNINFLHRYWAVKKSCLSFQTDLDDDHFVEKYFHDNYNWTITGFRKNDRLNVSQFLVVLSAMVVMTVNFSIAAFLATQTIAQIRVAKTFTSNYRALQIKILRALFAQASVPVLFVYIPFGCAIMFPFLNIDDKLHLANLCFTFTSFFPSVAKRALLSTHKNFGSPISMKLGRHKIRPEKISMYDFALGTFKRVLEEVQQGVGIVLPESFKEFTEAPKNIFYLPRE
ncbi:hypothetical protein PRIPAC_74071 [Pristionchus pacificus]|uniref:G protein-coupled receptor n=1 Tax=Pristionchus pacificus TaxID=54126 RepID=A0A2A6C7V4_PRIPA|nr:hypothetical protein PRIPAC_74071 [Pristionchus pacificus]|eukprot:PDM74187.1 G protein-coupled receptor [Pristionchus pacificus]